MRQSDHTIKNFKRELIIDGNTVLFEFVTMNRVYKQLFQVHVVHEAKKYRFHMQGSETAGFKITRKEVCPQAFWPHEGLLSDVILAA